MHAAGRDKSAEADQDWVPPHQAEQDPGTNPDLEGAKVVKQVKVVRRKGRDLLSERCREEETPTSPR
jgi:hypothetical protein